MATNFSQSKDRGTYSDNGRPLLLFAGRRCGLRGQKYLVIWCTASVSGGVLFTYKTYMYFIYVNNTLPLALAVHEITRNFWAAYAQTMAQTQVSGLRQDSEGWTQVTSDTGCIKKKVIELCSALARSLYNLQKSFFHWRKDQAFSFRLSSFL